MMRRIVYLLLLPVLLGISFSSSADDDHQRARELVQSGAILPLEKVLKDRLNNGHWRLLEAELEEEDGRLIYEIELLDEQGRVWELEYDARTGHLLEQEGED
jgi:uncharacterized membrane protein YkoI